MWDRWGVAARLGAFGTVCGVVCPATVNRVLYVTQGLKTWLHCTPRAAQQITLILFHRLAPQPRGYQGVLPCWRAAQVCGSVALDINERPDPFQRVSLYMKSVRIKLSELNCGLVFTVHLGVWRIRQDFPRFQRKRTTALSSSK